MKANKKVNKEFLRKLNCGGSYILAALAGIFIIILLTTVVFNAVGTMVDDKDADVDPNWKEPTPEETKPSQPAEPQWVDAPAGYWGGPVPADAIWIP